MSLRDYLAIYAKYNAFANDQVLAAAEHVRDDDYYKPILPRSRSIHGILNHVIAADMAWIGEMKQEPSGIVSRDQIVCESRQMLWRERGRTNVEMISLVDDLSEADLMSMIEYQDAAAGSIQWPLALELAHVFRHSSHHRGQLTILLEACGVEAPKIDELFVPQDMTFEVCASGAP